MLDSGLEDLPLMGYHFTWSRSLGTPNTVEERLDRGLANRIWLDRFPGPLTKNISAPISDQCPIVLMINPTNQRGPTRLFRFENKWCLDPTLPDIVRDCWTNLEQVNILEKLTATSESLMVWASHLDSNSKLQKKWLEGKIQHLLGRRDARAIHVLLEAKRELANLLQREEIHWRQRAKQFWLKDGDRNSKFFNAMASARRKVNTILRHQRDDGSWTTNTSSLHTVVVKEYFQNLFSTSNRDIDFSQVLQRLEPIVDEGRNFELTKPFEIDEFKEALFQMHPDKSPGPGCFNPCFYQKF